MGSSFLDVPEESTGANSIPSPSDDAGAGVGTGSSTEAVDSVARGVRSGDTVSVGAAAGWSVGADDVGVGVDTESSTGGADWVAAGFRSGDVVSVGTAAAWSVGADGPHPARTAVTLDTTATMASRTTSFLISLHLYVPKSYLV